MVELERAVMLLSIDTEMAWGRVHDRVAPAITDERALLGRLLDVLDRYDVPATWAVVGHLFLEHCEAVDGVRHPEIVRPAYDWMTGDWFNSDPCSGADAAPTWYAPDLVDEIVRRSTGHEIGSHSFSHMIIGDPGCSAETFRSELRRSRELAVERGIELTSFVYPRNRYGHRRVLAEEGFVCYRGPRPAGADRGFGARVRRVLDRVAPGPDSIVSPYAEHGVWNFPATYLFAADDRVRGRLRTTAAKRRLLQACAHRGLFHVWFHPHNMVASPDAWFAGFERVLRTACDARDAGRLDTITMGALAGRLGPPPLEERRGPSASHAA